MMKNELDTSRMTRQVYTFAAAYNVESYRDSERAALSVGDAH